MSKGMVVIGSFVGEEEDDLYVWIRRFESEEQREQLYESVYECDTWTDELGPLCGEMLYRERTIVTRLQPTPRSVIR
jgi:hypothetical protein